jgi:uncharacterized protein with HEPN domain
MERQGYRAAQRILADLESIEELSKLDPANLEYHDLRVLAVHRMWMDIGFGITNQLGLTVAARSSTHIRRVIQMRNRLAHSAIDDENISRLWHDSKSIIPQMKRFVLILIDGAA